MMPYLLAAGTALLVSLLVVPPTIRLARALDLLDAPDAVRRLHSLAVPRLGGIAVWCGVGVGLASLLLLPLLLQRGAGLLLAPWHQPLAVGLGTGVGLMLGVGLIDDVRGLRPVHKLVAQVLAALAVIAAGFRIEEIAVPGVGPIGLGWLAVPLTLLWIVGVTNAFNLIDGLDGLAGGVALVGLVSAGVAAHLLDNQIVLALAVPLAASVVGFLRYNMARPSRIFLGDVGSLSIGFALAVLTVVGARRPDGPVEIVVPLFALAFPILDTAIAMLRRWLRGVPLTGADGRHLHHQLVCLGLSRTRAAAVICLFAACFATLGLSLAFAPPTLTLTLALLGGGAVLAFLVHGLRWLGYHEFVEAQASFTSGLFKARSVIRDRILARELDVRIRNAASYTALEVLLDDVVRTFGFERVVLTDAAASSYEEPRSEPGRRFLRLDYPIVIPERTGGDEFVLRIWWRSESRHPPLYAERIIRMIAPAIGEALRAFARPVDARSVPFATAELASAATISTRGRRQRGVVRSR